ncbi:MAG: transposase [Chloroflexota bacterium]|nr:transposase [Chloroflexota bacterium]
MDDALSGVDFTALELAPPVRKLVQRLLNCIETLVADLHAAQAELQRLRDEIARLKGEKGKPKFKANCSSDQDDDDDDNNDDDDTSQPQPEQANGNQPRSSLKPKPDTNSGPSAPRNKRIAVDREEVIKLDRSQLPPDVRHRGYRDVIVQNIVFETDTVRYRLERLYSASEDEFYAASLPAALQRQRYGSELQAFVIMLYFELRVTEEKILNLLQAAGIVISAGQISNILIKKHLQLFGEERQAVLRAGLQTTSYQHIDDTGARVDGVNHYFSTLCNPYYSSFFTRRHKNHDTVAGLLAFLEKPAAPGSGNGRHAAGAATKPKQLGDYVSILICDDASQFHNQTAHRGLCWVHEERHFKKLQPFFATHQKLVADLRSEIWDYYERLKAYAAAPTAKLKQKLSADFDELFSRTTGYEALDRRSALTLRKKRELLLVLDFPEVPLDNNAAERALREYVVKRKISNGTRTAAGTKSWEIFLSLLDTCRKNGVSFYDYLCDRISKSYALPSLASLVLAHARDAPG